MTLLCNGRDFVAQGRELGAGPRRFLLTDNTLNLGVGGAFQTLAIQRGPAREQLVEHNTECVDVRARVHILAVESRLLRTHVFGGADELADLGEEGFIRQLLAGGARNAKINDLGQRLAIDRGYQDVGRLEVAMDDAFLMRMLHRLTDMNEQLQPLAQPQLV
ncbi:MAG: hypothetical protein U1F71_24710 [Verrucomicrobiaceae bacterium]